MSSYGSHQQQQQQQGIYFGAYYGEEVKRAGNERRGAVVCPNPRRAVRLAGPEPVRPFTNFNICEQVDPSCWNNRAEIFDIFSRKDAETNQVESSPPYFCGSPPIRTSNPLVRDKRFGEEDPLVQTTFVPVPTSSSCKGYAPAKFGFQPATMRIVGFDCLNRDRRGRGITAIA